MFFGVIYSCLRLLLDLVYVRRRMQDPEAELLLLRHQLRVLRRQVKRPRLEPADRLIMAGLSRLVSREALSGLLVQPETVLRWHRELVRRKWAAFGSRRGPGRPPLSDEVCALILRMAKENRNWGCVRICEELIKVGHRVSITAIRNLLRKHRVPGAPTRSRLSWKAFLKAQASAIVLTDFIEVDTALAPGASVLAFDVRVRQGSQDRSPDHLHALARHHQVEPALESGVVVANQNFASSPCLDWILIANRRHLERVLSEWFVHYNEERPHRALELKTPIARSDPVGQAGSLECRSRLGGLLNSYSRTRSRVAA